MRRARRTVPDGQGKTVEITLSSIQGVTLSGQAARSSFLSTMFDVDLFIECIHERPSLWEKSCKDYSDKHKREKSWMEIGEVIYENYLDLEANEREKKGKFCFLL